MTWAARDRDRRASATVPEPAGHDHFGLGCREHTGCRPAPPRRSAWPDWRPIIPALPAASLRALPPTLHPNGYTLHMPVLSSFVSLPGVAANVPIQLPRDFSAIGFAGENPMFVVVNPSLGITKLSDLIARAKAHPDDISCAVTGVGRLTHLTAELLQSRSGIKVLTVPYTGGPA
ncbi:MAG TPA: tripartite tricarboxylate transporter substrate-binding protein [Xanthobacteraceae bacterium]|nr:tripartite tricarboxylate transporter substrate-binding protein [Xanthobacteraceae bacterium]